MITDKHLPLDLLLRRVSVSPRYLLDPGPDDEELKQIIKAAVTVPDHGNLQPWRFLVVRGDERLHLGQLYAEATRRRNPEASFESLELAASKAVRSPLLIVLYAHLHLHHPKVPEQEQLYSCAMAAQNILLALSAMGFGGILVTGPNATDPVIHQGLGLADHEAILGFLHIGSLSDSAPKIKVRPEPQTFMRLMRGGQTVPYEGCGPDKLFHA